MEDVSENKYIELAVSRPVVIKQPAESNQVLPARSNKKKINCRIHLGKFSFIQ